MAINYDSSRAIAVLKHSDHECLVHMYSLKTYKLVFEEKFGDRTNKSKFIKLSEVEQNSTGDKFAAAYFNDGLFFVRTFGLDQRTEEEILKEEL